MTNGALNRQIAEEAADWAVRLDARDLSEDERRALAKWLAASPVHVDELLFAASILGGLERVDADRHTAIEALLAAHAPEVVPLFTQGTRPTTRNDDTAQAGADPGEPARRRSGRPMAWMAAAAALLLMLAGAAFMARSPWAPWNGDIGIAYDTATGEQRSIVLEDGSLVHLNTNSSVHVMLTRGERRIDLLRGEALFEVAHDATRPFRVYADDIMTQAVGTKFNVQRNEDGVHVVVVEGKVLVRSEANSAFAATGKRGSDGKVPEAGTGEVLVPAGYRADVTEGFLIPKVSSADIAEVSLWRARQLSFENQTLATIAAEFNRYNRMQLVVADTRLADARFSGAFKSNDPESFLAFLQLTPGVQIDRSDPERIVLTLDGR